MLIIGIGEYRPLGGEPFIYARFQRADASQFDMQLSSEQLVLLMDQVEQEPAQTTTVQAVPAQPRAPAIRLSRAPPSFDEDGDIIDDTAIISMANIGVDEDDDL